MVGKTKNSSDQYSTSGIGGENYVITVTNAADADIVNPLRGAAYPGRTTIEIHNSGLENVYIYFPETTYTEGRILAPDEKIQYALIDNIILQGRASATTADLRITEIR